MNSNPHQPSRKRLLLVDDEPFLLRLFAEMLRAAGHYVGTAANGMEGLAKFQSGNWNAVITDRSMPILSGEEMAVSIKAINPATPIILISGLVHTLRHPHLFAAVLQKPFLSTRLLAVITEVTGARHAHEHDSATTVAPEGS